MGFIRIKKINGQEYGYYIENKWYRRGKKGSRQKISQYLGKIVHFDIVSDGDFFSFAAVTDHSSYVNSHKRGDIVKDLVAFELMKRGFVSSGKKMSNKDVTFDLSRSKFVNSLGKEERLVLPMNEGFLCPFTLRRLMTFRGLCDEEERERGIRLAHMFLEAGLLVPHEIFIGYFEKI